MGGLVAGDTASRTDGAAEVKRLLWRENAYDAPEIAISPDNPGHVR